MWSTSGASPRRNSRRTPRPVATSGLNVRSRSGQPGCLQGQRAGPLDVVVLAGDQLLREQAAAGLEVGHVVPAAEGVGGEVADGVEQLRLVLAADVRAGAHVLLDRKSVV